MTQMEAEAYREKTKRPIERTYEDIKLAEVGLVFRRIIGHI
jgi:hypothetical protein